MSDDAITPASTVASRADFHGTWRLLQWRETSTAGEVRSPFGTDCFGRLTYTPDGFMHAVLVQSGRADVGVEMAALKEVRANIASPMGLLKASSMVGPLLRYAQASSGFVAYGGGYTLSEDRRRIAHSVEYSLTPDWIGDDQVRDYTFHADGRLTLEVDLGGWHQALTWRRETR